MADAEYGATACQAVVLAGGFGQRLLPLTRDRPKAMVEVCGTPILRRQINWFAESGVEHVTIAAGHLAAVIIDYLESHKLPLRVEVVVEERPLGRGGGLKRSAKALPYPDEPWLAAYGDICTCFPLADMYAHHVRHGASATVALAHPTRPRAGVECDERGRVTTLESARPPSPRVNAGIYLFDPDVIGLLPDEGDHVPSTLARLIRSRQLVGYPVDVPWWAVNTSRDLADLERELDGRPSAHRV
ncbi:nucleotidyltransferase family protein [Streptomyces sp. NPDC050617]|uniref:nucleotidyltransferase family protein n=1 Tax=Streptomyces sp. NPDC050617 TaxID=3154628 RepID=UPI003416D490